MLASASELVVVFHQDACSTALQVVNSYVQAGRLQGIAMRPLAPQAALAIERLAHDGESDEQRTNRHERSRFYSSPSPRGRTVESALDELRSLPGVETAYWKPGVENPLAPPPPPHPSEPEAPMVLPSNFSTMQGYLGTAPSGVNADAAWAHPGGTGAGVRVVDIEGGWQFTHIDLLQNSGGLQAGTQYGERGWRDHGTAVLGEIGGDKNEFGVCGIAPDAVLSCVSHGGLGSSRAISTAANLLRAGDVLLLEMHRPGPRFGFTARQDQRGYIAVEWWPDDLAAIQGAVAKGITVVEAAGNGAESLDDAFYDAPGPQFPSIWRNPFRGAIDSGAILVGAGAPPGGVFGPDRSRMDFSNWGQRVDCQGWGRGVVTSGYGDFYSDPQDRSDENYWYTSQFSGTSSASPIVTGVVACLAGIARASGKTLTPYQLRQALRATGSPQVAGGGAPDTQRIGTRPDMRVLVQFLNL